MRYFGLSKGLILSILVFVLVGLFLVPAFAQELGIARELLLFEEISVVTASKREQKISEAPVAMSVITREDIRQTGATQLSEVLNFCAGVHFGYTLFGYPLAGGIRGFHKLPANKVVLLVNGVPVSFELYGVPRLDLLPISLEEIERIEILRGAGSSLYGPNAMLGVINVITRKPEDFQGNLLNVSAGNNGLLQGTYMHGGQLVEDNLFYRLALNWDQRDNWEYVAFAEDPVHEIGKLSTEIDYYLDDSTRLNLLADYQRLVHYYGVQPITGPVEFSGSEAYSAALTYRWQDPDIMVKAFFDHTDLWDAGWAMGKRDLYFKMGTRGAEFQHTFQPVEDDVLLWGVNYQQVYSEGPSIRGEHRHDLSGVFLDNTYHFSEQWALNSGLRFDHGPNTDDNLAHRAAVLYSPWENQTFRLTWATSFRNPDFIESYFFDEDFVVVLGVPVPLITKGNEEIEAEKAEIVELAYRGLLTKKLKVNANVFYSEAEDFVACVLQSGGPPYVLEFMNSEKMRVWGTELELEYPLAEWLTALGAYAYYDMWEKEPHGTYGFVRMTPQHMFSSQFRARFDNGVSANLMLLYRGSNFWDETEPWDDPRGCTWGGGKAHDYLIANLRLAYAFKLFGNDAEIALVALNLTDEEYDDYPLSSSDVHRTVYLNFQYKF